MDIPEKKLVLRDWVLVQQFLPRGYTIVSDMHVLDNEAVATVAVASRESGIIHFKFFDTHESRIFKLRLIEIHPELNPKKVFWQVFYWDHNRFLILDNREGYKTQKDALTAARNANVHKLFICMMRKEDRDSYFFKTISTQVVRGPRKEELEPDLGPTTFYLVEPLFK